MAVKDSAMAYQRQRWTLPAHLLSGIKQSDGDILAESTAVLSELESVLASGTDGTSNAGGTTVTVGDDGFANVLVGDYIVFGDTSPDRKKVTARTDTTVTIAALDPSLRSQTAQDWRIFRPQGLMVAQMKADDDTLVHVFKLPSHFDAQQDLELFVHFTAIDAADDDEIKWIGGYKGLAVGAAAGDGWTNLGEVAYEWKATDTDSGLIEASLGTIPHAALHKGGLLGVRVQLSETDMTITGEIERLFVESLELEYTPKWTTGAGAEARPYRRPQRGDRW